MASTAPFEPVQSVSQAPTGKKKNNKKKKNANKPKPAAEVDHDGAQDHEREDVSDLIPDAPKVNAPDEPTMPESPARSELDANGHATTNGHTEQASDTTAKLEAMSQEREALRQEVEQLRKQLESIQETHNHEVTQLKSDLEESEAAKDHVETQYETLRGRVEKIKETLGDRLKRDKAELEEAKDRIDELEAQNEELQTGSRTFKDEIKRLEDEMQEQSRELSSLRSRNNLSQQNWLKEKDDMTRQMQHFKGELESTSNAMGEWEVIAMEERSMRESLVDKVADLEEQLATVREAYERAALERDSQSQTIDGLQRALQEIQEARKKELREMVETSEEQLQEMRKRAQDADSRAAEAESAKENLVKELERTAPFEKEVKEKNLLIGKLRHEAIVLNDHLTKALKYIKKTKPEETIDRQIVTNHFLQFLSLDRSDPKKFQILQVIAGLLNWTDEQREQAGLARPGAASSTLRLPSSPFHRTPSSPALNTEFFSETSSMPGKESLAELWAGFLERSVEEAGAPSRKGSMSSVATAATRPDTRGHS
ncbi:putative golgi matrix protein [Phialemonium atrogriseum]|uniref:Golgi matrix protein n=1 Tax=Phialemonium atrogriseum TaxID=1093897 RepID=A0AAJ0CC34_9PEZI|nr:putative golgi matrix protein [Phialemonium atrogriseum]KAK1772537.1 putative golgi matrix protein [Phialemonium atrogriseum]